MNDALESLRFLVRSDARLAVLRHLLDHGPTERRALNRELAMSRSSLARALASLEERDWIEDRGDCYGLTPVGEVITAAVLDLVESVEMATDLAPVLKSFPITEYDLDLAALRDADVTLATDVQPHAPVHEHAKPLTDADTYRAILPSIFFRGENRIHERIAAGELDAEFVVGPSVAEEMTDGEAASLFREQIAGGSLSVFVAGSIPSFFLSVIDGELVQIGVSNGGTNLDVLLQSTDADLREWARALFREHRSAGRQLLADDFRA